MPESLLEAYVQVSVNEKQAVASVKNIEKQTTASLKGIDKGTIATKKEFDVMFGKAGDAAKSFEHTLKHAAGHWGKAFFAGGLAGAAGMGITIGLETALEKITEHSQQMAEALKAASERMAEIRKGAMEGFMPFDRLTDSIDEVMKGGITGDQGKRMLEAIDSQANEIRKRRDAALTSAPAVGTAAYDAAVEEAIKSDHGKALYDKLRREEMAKANVGEFEADPISRETRKQAEREAMRRFGQSTLAGEIISHTETEAARLRDLEKRRADVLKASGLDPRFFGPDANPFLSKGGGGGTTDVGGAFQNIQEAALGGGEKPASKDEQKKQTSIQERMVNGIERLAGVAGGGGGAVWG